MVGAKQFAIMRKIIQEKIDNPVAKKINLPPELSGANAFANISGSFMDGKRERIKPKLSSRPSQNNNIMNLLDNFMLPDFMKSSFIIAEEPMEMEIEPKSKNKKDEIPEELINKITYQVFQNIRKYLDEDRQAEEEKKKIKIEICM